MNVQPFEVHIPEATLQDLRERLARIRWPDEIPDTGWEYGTNLAYLKELVHYWQTQFNWRAQEKMMNQFAHFRADLDGFNIHFIHEQGKGPNPLPIIITHGWPSSFLEMLKIIPLLTDPERHGGKAEDSFDVVVPSLPGYGFSDRPAKRGMTISRIANIWARLMTEALGYDRFAAQGGDHGASVTEQLAASHSDLLVGIHLDMVPAHHVFERPPAEELLQSEKDFLHQLELWLREEGGYAMIQATKPQTLAYALNDSPAGLAAWILEKFRSWSDCDGSVEKRFTKDELLTNITLYWVTETVNAASRLYYEAADDYNYIHPKHHRRSEVGTAIAIFPKDIIRAPRQWAERWLNVMRWTEMPRGGHFAAMEEPKLLANDIITFFRPLRSQKR
jgi:pimeloyl-ACP methyl ester carboxylesterase